MQKKRRAFIYCAMIAALLIALATVASLLSGAGEPFKETLTEPSTLSNLAYDEQPQFGYVVYLEEASGYHPYYVLTSCYYGRENETMLLRKYLLDELREYHPYKVEGTFTAYYENSSIDQFLNGEFYETLSPAVQENILNSTIAIADRSTLASTQKLTIDIERKVFLLAVAELEGYDKDDVMQDEGPWLQYFQDAPREDHIARYATGRAETWWTRSASMWGSTSVFIINLNSGLGNAQTGYLLGVRPAFCLPGDLPVELRAGTYNGAQGYVISWE